MDAFGMAGHWIRRLHQHSTAVFTQRMQRSGIELTPVQFATLAAISAAPGSDQAAIAECIGYDRATIGGVVERLEKKGWVDRTVSEQDRRARVLTLSRAGRALYAKALPLAHELQADILQPLSPDEREAFISLARRVTQANN